MVLGYDFIWMAFKNPFFRKPDGTVIECSVRGYVPYVRERGGMVPSAGEVVSSVQPAAVGVAPSEAQATDSGDPKGPSPGPALAEVASPAPDCPSSKEALGAKAQKKKSRERPSGSARRKKLVARRSASGAKVEPVSSDPPVVPSGAQASEGAEGALDDDELCIECEV